MKPVYQTITNHKHANCLQACVASYLELPLSSVPNFMLFENSWWEALHWWFHSKGYDIGHVEGSAPNDGKYYIVSEEFGEKYDFSHAVIYKNGVIVHDPSKHNRGMRGHIVGHYWISKKQTN